MKTLTGSLLAIIFLLLAAIHIYWAFGRKTGYLTSIPTTISGKPLINPGKTDCFVVAIGLLLFGIFVLIRSGLVSVHLPGWLFNYGAWVISLLFLLRAIGEFKYIGFFKKVTTTGFGRMDTMYYSPLCLVIAALSIALNIIN